MTLTALILISCSIFLHVGWNMISKATRPSMAFYTLMSATGATVCLPFFLMSEWRLNALPPQFFGLCAASIAFEIIYVFGLARAYKSNDISLVYPMIRALPVLLTAALTLLLGIGRPFGPAVFGGMVMIACGCMIMPFASFRRIDCSVWRSRMTVFILLGAAGTTGYTLCDSRAMGFIRESSSSGASDLIGTLGFLFMIELGLSLGSLLVVLSDRRERLLFSHMFGKTLYPSLAGCCSSGAYVLVLLAMGHVNNVSYIQAFRQLSLPVGFFFGVFLLREKGSPPKVCGMVLIVAGLLIVSLCGG